MRSIYINLPVADLEASKRFFGALGFSFNPQFTNEHAACMVVSDTIAVMLLTHAHFMNFSPQPISDAKTKEVLLCLSCESRAEVDALAAKAIAAGAKTHEGPQESHGFLYGYSFLDLDGHAWELMHMDMSKMPQG